MGRAGTHRDIGGDGSKPAGWWLKFAGFLALGLVPLGVAVRIVTTGSLERGEVGARYVAALLGLLIITAVVGAFGLLAWRRPVAGSIVLLVLGLSLLLPPLTSDAITSSEARKNLALVGSPVLVSALLFFAANLRSGWKALPGRAGSQAWLFLLLVAAYWLGMAAFLGVAFLVGIDCWTPVESGDQCAHYTGGDWPSWVLVVLPVFALVAVLLVFTRPGRRWRLRVYGIQLGLAALVAWLFWLSVGTFGLAAETTTSSWPWFAIALGAQLAALLAIVIPIRRPQPSAQSRDPQ